MATDMTAKQRERLLTTLQARFEQHSNRHPGLRWADVLARLQTDAGKLRTLDQMEATGGQPDVVALGRPAGAVLFVDCSAESPSGRRSFCYDDEALQSRKENKPAGSALGLAAAIGITLLTEEQYRALQQVGEFDTKTSSWVLTPPEVRALGGALFCDRRYGQVFVYHNGAQSYYAARGFRGAVSV